VRTNSRNSNIKPLRVRKYRTLKEKNYLKPCQFFKLLLFMLNTPLEQFQIILLFSIKLFCFDFSITNLVLVNFLVLLIFGATVLLISSITNPYLTSFLLNSYSD